MHDCLTDSEKNVTRGKLPSFRSSSVPPRPPTRRNPLEMTDLTQVSFVYDKNYYPFRYLFTILLETY